MTLEQAVAYIEAIAFDPEEGCNLVSMVRQAERAPLQRMYFLYVALAALAATGNLKNRRTAVEHSLRLTVVLPPDAHDLTRHMTAMAVAGHWESVLATAVSGIMRA